MDSSSGNTSDDASDTPPKRFKGDNGHPQLPDSILKDEPLEEAETAPHRERRKSRKSVGRRVSFAPTAHVRMFEVPEEKQQAAPNSNTYEMPDISSQTGMLGFNLGIMPAVEETSMASNESFDVSVRHSDPSESLQSSEGSFSADTGHGSVGSPAAPAAHRHGNGQEQRYASILDNDDDDDDDEDLDEADGDDAVTMELTGTVDMGAIGNDDESDAGSSGGAGGGEELSPSNLTSGFRAADSEATPLLDSVDASNFFSMLMQSNAADQHTSLLDNILSQFGDMPQSMSTDYTMNSIRDTDLTRVAVPVDDSGDELDTVVQADISGPAANELANAAGSDGSVGGGDDDDHDDDNDDDDDDADDMEMGHDVDDAVTMDLTGVVSRWSGDSGLGAGGEMDEQAGAIDIASAQSQHGTPVAGGVPVLPISADRSGVGPASLAVAWGQASSGALMDVFGSLLATSLPAAPASLATGDSLFAVPSKHTTSPLAAMADAAPAVASTPDRRRTTPAGARVATPAGARVTTPAGARVTTPAGPRVATPASKATPVAAQQWATHTPSAVRTPATPGSRLRYSARTPTHDNTLRAGDAPAPTLVPAARTPALRSADAHAGATPRSAGPAKAWADEDIPVAPAKQPTFVLDPLPPIPRPIAPPAAGVACGPASRAELAKAGLVMDIFETYRHQRLVPEASPAVAQLAEVPLKFEPLFRKSELKARLEYCSALSGLFEADHCVSRAAAAEPMAFGELASFFGAQNELLSDRREELLLRISRMRQRLVQEAPGKETGKLFGETQELRMKLLSAKREREAIGADIEQLGAEIQALQTTGTSFDRQLSERKSAQEVLLAINGLQPVDVGADCCDFIYDGFSRLHFGDSAEFTSLHPDIDWAAAIRGAIGSSDLSMRQYTIAAMKANAVLKGLLEDVRRVKRHTFVELLYSDGIYVRLQFFSRAHRQRFHLQIPLASVESYTRLHLETEFDWATDVLYGDVDAVRLRECLRACRIDPSLPVLSIYEHVESSMGAF